MIAAILLAGTAQAGPMIVAEGVTTLVGLGDTAVNLGSGIGARVGLPIDIVLVELVPEVGVTVWSRDALVVVPEIGARFNIGKAVEPGAYGHVTYLLGPGSAPGWDAGLTLDVTVIPKIDFGVQTGLMAFDGAPALTAGLHVGVKL